ncbi:MAG TPA: universal stress protein [Bryobacteraceae bacterium]|jgi:nucleotide-binding universal stress UspA family protein|nr:universal stress protein [Bryobacteraceae bacterium]
MPKIEHILFPYDFSHQCTLVAPYVRAVACRFGTKLTLLGVVPTVWDTRSADMPILTGAAAPEVELKMHLDKAAGAVFAGLPVETATALGDAAFKIEQIARIKHVDLIMMPTHGFGTFRTLLIGSVTAKVLHDSKCPVWTAAHSVEQSSPDVPRKILCAVDRTAETVKVMKWAAEYSQKMGATLKLLHVVTPVSDILSLPGERQLQEEVRKEAANQIQASLQKAGVEIPFTVAVGSIMETVTEEARREQADLIIIGRGSLPNTLGALHTHAYGIIQQSPCPVLSV